jgi:hypothetical protein
MWRMLQNNIAAARHMKNLAIAAARHMKNLAIVVACGANNHVFFPLRCCLHVMLLCVRKNGRNVW